MDVQFSAGNVVVNVNVPLEIRWRGGGVTCRAKAESEICHMSDLMSGLGMLVSGATTLRLIQGFLHRVNFQRICFYLFTVFGCKTRILLTVTIESKLRYLLPLSSPASRLHPGHSSCVRFALWFSFIPLYFSFHRWMHPVSLDYPAHSYVLHFDSISSALLSLTSVWYMYKLNGA